MRIPADTPGLYEVCDAERADRSDKKMATRELFQEGVALYARGDVEGAARAFDAVLAVNPDDGPARHYRTCCREPAGTWTGVITLDQG